MLTIHATATLLIGVILAIAEPNRGALTPQAARDWLLHVIPLPKEVTIEGKLVVRASRVAVEIQGAGSSPHVLEARALVHDLLERSGLEVPPSATAADFVIKVGVLDDEGTAGLDAEEAVKQLRRLKNRDQAYLIHPIGDRTLVVTGLDTRGVFYGVKTLRQLLAPTLTGEGDSATLTMPVARIVDWPDLNERGEWGGSVNRDIEWLADRKMNLCESHCRGLTVADDGRGSADFDKTLIERGAKCAVKVVPIITHLDQLERTGLFKVYPKTLGEGDPKTWPYGGTTVKPACFSKPETAKVLADWMVSLAEQPEITNINVWLSEHHVACACEDCKQKGQFALEADAVGRGYALAKKARPDIKLRVLLTQGSYEFNAQVIEALPREIGITYYDGGRTYDSSREPMIYPLLEQYAKEGGWLGCYPQFDPSWRIVCPWSGPQFMRFRMQEFVEDGLECLCGYATPDNRFWDFNVNAAAEWSWNANGRDEREFALAYFTKKGMTDPQKAADWAVMLGPVGWDVYGARVPYSWFFGGAARSVKEGNVPGLGNGPYRYFPDEAHFAKDLAVCADAMKLATQVGDLAMIAETRTIEGYVKMLKVIRELGKTIGKKKELSENEKQAAARLMGDLDLATKQTTEGLLAWGRAVAPDAMSGRFDDTIQVTKQTCVDIGAHLDQLLIGD